MSRTTPEPGPEVALKVAPDRGDGVVAVMSHHATFAMQMRRAGFDVREGRDIEELAALARTVDIVVVDLVAVEGRRGLVARLSTSIDSAVPVVLISADEVDLALLGPSRSVHVVVPPVRADDVVTCVRRVLSERPPGGAAAAHAAQAPFADGNVTPLRGRETRKARREAERTAKPVVPQADSRPDPGGQVIDLTQWEPPRPTSWQLLAVHLRQAVTGIPALPTAVQALAVEVAGTSGADVVVLVRDDRGTWQVEGGVGLRPFEWGQTLDDNDWLVVTGRDKYPSLLVADTDAVRGDLVGAPLASRRQLVRTHSGCAPVMVCAGWSEDADGDARVALVVAALKRHEAAISAALELRQFVRTLVRQVDGIDAVLD